MNRSLIPAAPGYVLINHEGSLTAPVVAWAIPDHAVVAIPVVAFSLARLTEGLVAGDAVTVIDSGTVMDLATGMIFENVSDWRTWVDEQTPYTKGDLLTGAMPAWIVQSGAPEGDPAAVEAKRNQTRAPRPDPNTAQAPGAVGPYRIPFGGKTYKLETSWHFLGEEGEFIFKLAPDTASPSDSRCQKTNRDEFDKLKKAGTKVLDYAVVHGDVAMPEDEVQAPAATDDDEFI